jgi:hypothetical protein
MTAGTWELLGSLAPSRLIRVCPEGAILSADAMACKNASGTYVSTWMSRAQLESATSNPSYAVTVTWVAPTQGTRDGVRVTLSAGDVVGYEIAWRRMDVVTSPTIIKLVADARSYPLTLPLARVCVTMRALGAELASDSSAELCVDPKPIKPDAPSQVVIGTPS